jgi:hypothetical protein
MYRNNHLLVVNVFHILLAIIVRCLFLTIVIQSNVEMIEVELMEVFHRHHQDKNQDFVYHRCNLQENFLFE